jgi:TolA-binding protein
MPGHVAPFVSPLVSLIAAALAANAAESSSVASLVSPSLALSSGVAVLVAPQQDADEAAAYVVGLAQKELHDLVVKEGRAFLTSHAIHARATLVRYLVADALFELSRFADAKPLLETVVADANFDQRREARFRLAQVLLELGDARGAAERLDAVLADEPDYLRAPAGFLLGEARFALSEFDAAEAAYWNVLQLPEPGRYGFDAACAMCWTAKARGAHDAVVQRAEACLQAAPGGDPRVSELWLLLGETHFARGEHERALTAFGRASGANEQNAAQRGAAYALVALGRDAEAAQRFETLLAALPEGDASRNDVAARAAAAHVRSGAFERALKLVEGGRHATAHYWRARALAGLTRHEEALSALDAAARAQPDAELQSLIDNARADALFALGRTAEAAKVYERAGGDYALHAAAIARVNAGDWAEAARIARDALERFPNSPHATANRLVLGEALFQSGERAAAREAFAAVTASASSTASPSDVRRARSRIAWCDFDAQKFEAAEGVFRELARDSGDAGAAREAEFMAARCVEERAGEDAAQRTRAAQAFESFATRHTDASQRAEALLRAGRLLPGERGEVLFVQLLADHGGDALAPRAALELGERRSARGAHAEAAAAFDTASAATELDVRCAALAGAAWSRFELGEHAAARSAVDTLLATKEAGAAHVASARELLVWIEAARGDGAAAEAAVRAFAKSGGEAQRVLAAAKRTHTVLVASGSAARAATLFADLARGTNDVAVQRALRVEEVFARLDANDVERAESLARELGAAAPNDAAVCEAAFFVGEARWASGDHTRALVLYDLAAAGGGTTRERALYKAGFAAVRLADHTSAAKRLETFRAEFDASALLGEVLFLLGESHFALGADEAARTALELQRKRFPRHELAAPTLFRLGLVEARLGRHAEAARALADLVRLAPDFTGRTEAELVRGRSLAALGDRRAARTAFGVVLTRDQGLFAARARLELGELSRAEGDLEAALGEFLKVAVLYEPCDEVADALVRAGSVLEARGEKDAALARYREVVKDHAERPAAAQARARITELEKKS